MIDSDGRNLRQLTDGPDNDIEPIYTPDGGIVFCSSRCHRFVPCWRTQVATLYRCDADGRNVRMLSNNAEQENTPWMLPDGRVLYMRWEYVDRHTTAYWTMFSHSLVADGRNGAGNRPPRTVGSSASRLMKLLDGSHYKAKPSAREQTLVRLWIESGAVYPGTYGALGSGIYPVQFPEATIRRRCAGCHQAALDVGTANEPRPTSGRPESGANTLMGQDVPRANIKKTTYRNPKPGAFYFQFGKREPPQPLLSDIYDIILIRHLAYFQLGEAPLYQALCNLDRPEKSRLLRAPLARGAGGLQLCGRAVFADQSDPDYREMRAAIDDAAERLVRHKRFDMPGFRPNRYYIREMQRFGVLPQSLPDDAPVNPYAADRAYWQTFEHTPPSR
jgi:hypothetical protein